MAEEARDWSALPPGVCDMIAACLGADGLDLVQMALTCKAFSSPVRSTRVWQALVHARFGKEAAAAVDKACALPVILPGWVFFPGMDSEGDDVPARSTAPRDPLILAAQADRHRAALPRSGTIAFSTLTGQLKVALQPAHKWRRHTYEPGLGLYVREDYVDERQDLMDLKETLEQAEQADQGPSAAPVAVQYPPVFPGWTFYPGFRSLGGDLDPGPPNGGPQHGPGLAVDFGEGFSSGEEVEEWEAPEEEDDDDDYAGYGPYGGEPAAGRQGAGFSREHCCMDRPDCRSLSALARLAASSTHCVAFDTWGHLKRRVRPWGQWTCTGSRTQGTWVRDKKALHVGPPPRPGSLELWKRLYFQLGRYRLSIAWDAGVTWLNGQYLGRFNGNGAFHCTEVVRLLNVCWLHMTATFKGVRSGRYLLIWHVRPFERMHRTFDLNFTAQLLDSRCTLPPPGSYGAPREGASPQQRPRRTQVLTPLPPQHQLRNGPAGFWQQVGEQAATATRSLGSALLGGRGAAPAGAAGGSVADGPSAAAAAGAQQPLPATAAAAQVPAFRVAATCRPDAAASAGGGATYLFAQSWPLPLLAPQPAAQWVELHAGVVTLRDGGGDDGEGGQSSSMEGGGGDGTNWVHDVECQLFNITDGSWKSGLVFDCVELRRLE